MPEKEQDESWGDQDEQGVDLARLRYNLGLSDEEKLRQHAIAARFVLECKIAAERAGLPRDTQISE